MDQNQEPLTRAALLEVFCQEARDRLARARAELERGPARCDYNAVHQEFDSLHGGARAADIGWLERAARMVAGYARFLRSFGPGLAPAPAHALLLDVVSEFVRQCHEMSAADLLAGRAPPERMTTLLGNLENQLLTRPLAEVEATATSLCALQLLVVDDSATSRLLFRVHLPTEPGYVAHEAADAESAVRLAVETRPHVVFLDYNMPDADGVEIARRIQAAGLTPVFVLLTANVQQAVLDAARAAGFTSVLEKPVTREKIMTVLSGVRP